MNFFVNYYTANSKAQKSQLMNMSQKKTRLRVVNSLMPSNSITALHELLSKHEKRMLHQALNVKKLNNFSNLKSVLCELCRISLSVIECCRDASKFGIFN